MPRGNPKKFTGVRLDPALLAEVQAVAESQATNVTAAVDEGLRLWLARTKRKADLLAKRPKRAVRGGTAA